MCWPRWLPFRSCTPFWNWVSRSRSIFCLTRSSIADCADGSNSFAAFCWTPSRRRGRGGAGARVSARPQACNVPARSGGYRELLLNGRDGRCAGLGSRCRAGLAEAHQAEKLGLLGGVAAKGGLRPVVPLVLLAGAQVHRRMLCRRQLNVANATHGSAGAAKRPPPQRARSTHGGMPVPAPPWPACPSSSSSSSCPLSWTAAFRRPQRPAPRQGPRLRAPCARPQRPPPWRPGGPTQSTGARAGAEHWRVPWPRPPR